MSLPQTEMTSLMPGFLERKFRSSSRSSSELPSATRCLMVAAMLVLLTSPADAYFMKCKQFCSMLTRDELKQLWCIYDMCRNEKLGRHILRYAKRGLGGQPDVAYPAMDALLDGSYYGDSVTLSHGRKERFSGAPDSGILRSIAKAREELSGRGKQEHGQDKRDVEYWDGPAPADINA